MPTITKPNLYFDVVTYTGTGATQTISGLNFQPDFVWIKSRSAATDNKLTDAVRGATKGLISNSTGAETTDSTGITAFTSSGFTLGSSSVYNNSGATYVAWCWKANGSGSTNTSGSITSTVSANTTSGFSVLTYTGTGTTATIGHGLGVAPSMVICKARTGTSVGAWQTYHSALGATKTVFLNLTDAAYTNSLYWNNTAPTSSVFSLGGNTDGNGSGYTMVAYCFAEVAGYSKFGSYTGNGSADGPFVYCGFRPRYIMVKGSSNSSNWTVIDTARDTYNACKSGLYPNLSAAESDPGAFDILSNGFKIRHTYTDSNGSGLSYIFAAFAEFPTKFALAR